MKFNMLTPILDYEGNVIEAVKLDAKGNPMFDEKNERIMVPEVLRTYLVNALNSVMQGETLVAEDKHQIYYLSVKLFQSKEVELTINDRQFILDRVSKTYPPLIYGRISDLFEGNDQGTDLPTGELKKSKVEADTGVDHE